MRDLQFGSMGNDVKAVQEKLQDLGYYMLAIDGRFGPGTEGAVMRFQRDNGLSVDGIVGQQTYAALGITSGDTGEASGTGSSPAARGRSSLHIGVNSVDPNQYNGWDGKLSGCENDSHTMVDIAAAEGFNTQQLLTAQATTANVLAGIATAAEQLREGDIFFLTYAGHGGQVPDAGSDAETDQQDETWVLFDRMLIDDELEQAFSAFHPGVDIVLLSDSCHSGTVYRKMFTTEQMDYARLKESFYQDVVPPPEAAKSASEVLARYFPRPAMAMTRGTSVANGHSDRFTRALSQWNGDLGTTRPFSWRDMLPAELQTREAAGTGSPGSVPRRFPGTAATATLTDVRGMEQMADNIVAVRAMPLAVNAEVVVRQAQQYADIKAAVRARPVVQARGLTISGCLDAQLSQEVGGNGVFTTALKRTWAEGRFTGSYDAFHKAILSQMGPSQTPQLSSFGMDAHILRQKTPFD